MAYSLIVPPCYETELTGLRFAAEKTVRNTVWRVECHTGETYPRFYKRKCGTNAPGINVPLAKVSERMAKFANEVTRHF